MLNEKQQQARNLFFQTDLTKTQIADVLNIGRRTLHYWIRENNWGRLKKNATILPAMIAENCYLLLNNFTQSLLSEYRTTNPVSAAEADILHKLALTVRKLKNHSTVNESMEMFGFLMDRINKQSPELADQVMPFVNEFIEERVKALPGQFLPKGFNDQGYISEYEREEQKKVDTVEFQKDVADLFAWEQEVNPTLIDLDEFRHREATLNTTATPGAAAAQKDTAQPADDNNAQDPGYANTNTTVDADTSPAADPRLLAVFPKAPKRAPSEAELKALAQTLIVHDQDLIITPKTPPQHPAGNVPARALLEDQQLPPREIGRRAFLLRQAEKYIQQAGKQAA